MVKDCFINSRKLDSIYFGVGKSNCLTYIPEDIKFDLDPLNATVVGNLTVNNGVVSGFSASNYLILPKVFNPGSNTWEIVLKAQLGSSTSDTRGLVGASNSKDYQGIALVLKSNKLYLYMSSNGTSWNIASNVAGKTTLSNGSYYYIKLAFTGSTYVVSYSENGSSWNTEISVSSTAKVYASANPLALGYVKYKSDSTQYFNGSIDLKGSYINVDSSIWWQGGTGKLTLQAGSKVYIPNGFEEDGITRKFDEVVIESDISNSAARTQNGSVITNGVKLYWTNIGSTFSGSDAPSSPSTGYEWYDTTNNILKRYNGSSWDGGFSLPVGRLNPDATEQEVLSEVQALNGFGYIGSHAYVLPGVKTLVANGFNTDGTYKSKEWTVDKVLLTDGKLYSDANSLIIRSHLTTLCNARYQGRFSANPQIGGSHGCYYNYVENIFYAAKSTSQRNEEVFLFGSMTNDGSNITSLTPREIQNNNQVLEVRRIYKGSQLIWGYDPSEIIFQSSTPGTYTVDILTSGYYNVAVVGGGSGGAYVYSSKFSDGRASGGSGAGFVGIVYLTAGNHTIKVGAGGSGKAYETNGQTSATSTAGGQSAIDSIIVAGGGGSAKAGIHGATQTAGSGGTLSYDSSKVQSYSLAKNGNAGTTIYNSNITGGASVYSNYGKGGNAGNSYTTDGGNGYVFISAVL